MKSIVLLWFCHVYEHIEIAFATISRYRISGQSKRKRIECTLWWHNYLNVRPQIFPKGCSCFRVSMLKCYLYICFQIWWSPCGNSYIFVNFWLGPLHPRIPPPDTANILKSVCAIFDKSESAVRSCGFHIESRLFYDMFGRTNPYLSLRLNCSTADLATF